MSTSGGAGSAAYVPEKLARVYVDAQGGSTDAAKLAAALSAASTFGGIVELPDRTLDVGTTFSMSGYSCGLVGRGAGNKGTIVGQPFRSVITASQQAGPVLDFIGFKWPDSMRGRVEIGAFAVQGSGLADPTLSNVGIRIANNVTAAASLWLHDITVSETGGPCLDTGILYLSTVDRVTMVTPVGANANNVPYFTSASLNGTTLNELGLRSMISSQDTGVGGAMIVNSGGPAVFNSTWFENLHVPNGGTLIANTGNGVAHHDVMFYDVGKDPGATGTSFARFTAPATDAGGNIWTGQIPGANGLDMGIDLQQSRNYFSGTKGYNGTNVTLAAGVGNTTAILGGEYSGAAGAAFVDNSGQTTNVLVDYTTQTETKGPYQVGPKAAANGGAGPVFTDYLTPANGAVWLGNSGPRIQAIGKNAYLTGDTFAFRNTALTGAPQLSLGVGACPRIISGSGVPTMASPVGSVYLRTDGGAGSTLYIKESGTDGTGWVAK